MKFEYRVIDGQGHKMRGILNAEGRKQLAERLMDKGYYIVSLKEINNGKYFNSNLPLILFPRVSIRDLVLLTRQLSTMLKAGLSILSCLEILGEQTANRHLKKAVVDIRKDVAGGSALWEATNRYPEIFTGVYVSMIKAGELGGMLDVVLERLSYHLEKEQEIMAKIRSASIYPLVVSVFAILAVFFIIAFVMPMFETMFQAAGLQLPLPTRILLWSGTWLRSWWIAVAIVIIVLWIFIGWSRKTRRGRLIIDRISLHIPVIGRTLNRVAVARFARTMGALIKSGIPVFQALEVVAGGIGNAVIQNGVADARAGIREGQSISGPLLKTGVFEPMVSQMIAVGEETGSLDEMLLYIADYFERELVYTVDALISVVQPLLILVVATLVGGVVLATLLPIFDMMTLIGI